ncbi:putative aldo-keto reductase [compost metagenome]
MQERNITLGQQVSEKAAEYGCSPSVLSLAWLLNRPAVSTVIVGATRTEQLEHNLSSLELELTDEMMDGLDQLSQSFRHAEPFATYRIDG